MATRTHRNGRKPWVPGLNKAEFEAVRRILLQTNRTRETGSIREALELAMEQELIRPSLTELIQARLAAGQSPLTERQMRRLAIPGPVVKSYRGPRRAWLEHVQSSGALQVEINDETGEWEHIPLGRRWTLDDGSINMLVTVPGLEIPGDKCFDRWGVVVGRFQLLLAVDHRSQMILSRNYTCRPRDAYRAEDLTATLHHAVEVHGAPAEIVLEKGISAAKLVTETLEGIGVRIIRASSPHQKIVELVFNKAWTSTSTLPGQIGRNRGEYEVMTKLHTAFKEGRRDPRGYLMSLPEFLGELDKAIDRVNGRHVNGRLGRWVPAKLWAQQEGTRQVASEDLALFAPVMRVAKLDWHQVTCSVQLVPGRSEQFVFGRDDIGDFHGARLKLFFNPLAEDCRAYAVLAHDHAEWKVGHRLGFLEQRDRLTKMTRRALMYGMDSDTGRAGAAAASRALVQSIRVIGAESPARKRVTEESEETQSRPARKRTTRPNTEPTPKPRQTTPPAYTDPRLAAFADEEAVFDLG
jgi:hypothetical protein